MALSIMTGRTGALRRAVDEWLKAADRAGDGDMIVLVPAQATLLAEREALDALQAIGSFRLRVMSPERLYARIFEQAGAPREARIDEQGRVMLMHVAAARYKKALTWYRGAAERPGFAERAVAEIARLKQARVAPDDVRAAAAAHPDDALGRKLTDLATLYEAYEQALSGRFLDGEDECARAIERMTAAPFLEGARVLVYGFDLISPPLMRTLLALTRCADDVTLAMAVENDVRARDATLFEPARRSLERLLALAQSAGVPVARVKLSEPVEPPSGALRHLTRELFSLPATPYAGAVRDVQLAQARTVQEEAEFVAAIARRLARTRGWRYRDMAVALATPDEAVTGALKRAFALYRVPLFLASGRPADRHPLSVFLLSALRAVSRGYPTGDMVLLIRSGFSGLEDHEADHLVNYALAQGLTGRRWRMPLTRGDEDTLARIEPLRERVMAPLLRFSERIKEADTTRERLTALVTLLEDARAYEVLEAQRAELEREGLASQAMEGAQVWQRIQGALDQIDELFADAKLPLKTLDALLKRALSTAVVKALPQSGDAVEGGSFDHVKGKPVKALFVVGASDIPAEGGAGLLDDDEATALGEAFRLYAALTGEQRGRMRRLSLKTLLSLTEAYLLISRPLSDAAGRALPPGALMSEACRLLPGAAVRGGVLGDARMRAVRLEQPDAAIARIPGLHRDGAAEARIARAALSGLPDWAEALRRMDAAKAHRVASEPLPEPLARAACGPLTGVSASRLERYASCPFRHFAHYALMPEEFQPFDLSPRDAGLFYHEALEAFVRENAGRLTGMTAESGAACMDDITLRLIDRVLETAAGDNPATAHAARRMRDVARRAASIIACQFEGSRFRPVGIEDDIAEDALRVRFDDASSLSGRIDRIDVFDAEGGARYVRVIDYKTGRRAVSLEEIYHGLQLQLMLYLAAAIKRHGGAAAGVFYFNVSDPLLATEERDPLVIEAAREKALRLDGLTLNDADVVAAMAREPARAVNVLFNKDGTLRSSDKVIGPADFDRLIGHTLAVAGRMLASLRAGDTRIAPAALGNKSACDRCDYRTLCQFDPLLDGASPRTLARLSAKDVLASLQNESDVSM